MLPKRREKAGLLRADQRRGTAPDGVLSTTTEPSSTSCIRDPARHRAHRPQPPSPGGPPSAAPRIPAIFTFTVEAPHLIKSSLANYAFQPIPSSAALLAEEKSSFSAGGKREKTRRRRRLEGWGCAGTRRDPAAPSTAR